MVPLSGRPPSAVALSPAPLSNAPLSVAPSAALSGLPPSVEASVVQAASMARPMPQANIKRIEYIFFLGRIVGSAEWGRMLAQRGG